MRVRYKLIGVADSAGTENVEAVAQQQDEPTVIELGDHPTVGDLTRKLKVTASHVLVNGGDASDTSKLQEDDEVTIFGPSAGAM